MTLLAWKVLGAGTPDPSLFWASAETYAALLEHGPK